MLQEILKHIKTSILILGFLILITGMIYPLLITLLAQLFFPFAANGSLIQLNEKQVGSLFIGQSFTDPKYFWGRPSATLPYPYNANNSNGSNLGPSNPKLFEMMHARIATLKNADLENISLIPIDLVTASGSGLDPHISPTAAYYQAARVAKARKLDLEKVVQLIKAQVKTCIVFCEPTVNVLELNIALDKEM